MPSGHQGVTPLRSCVPPAIEMPFQSVEMFAPQLPVAREPCLEFNERLGPDAIHATLRVGSYRDEAGFLEHSQVLRHCRLTQGEMRDKVPNRALAIAKQLDDGVTAGVTEHLERGRC